MHSDQFTTRYRPAVPSSPKMIPHQRPSSPQSPRNRATHSKQTSRHMQVDVPSYPSSPQSRSSAASLSSTVTSPAITVSRVAQPLQMESPRLMRQQQKLFLEQARLGSKLAASSMSHKPDAPRLDPLGSPKGPMTPFALEEGRTAEPADYFAIIGAGKFSPATSPGARSDRTSEKATKIERVDLYH